MGLFEILPHLPRLLRIRRNLLARVLAQRPDVYVGVDAQGVQPAASRRASRRVGSARCSTSARRSGRGARGACGHRPRGRPRAVPAAVREARSTTSMACARCSSVIRWPIRFRCTSTRARRARALRLDRDGRVRRAAARQPAGRGRAARAPTSRRPSRGCAAQRPELRFVAALANAGARRTFDRRARGGRRARSA